MNCLAPILTVAAFGLTAAAADLTAQEFTDTFDTDTQKTPSGWTAQDGNWRISNGRLVTDQSSKWAFITRDGLKPTNFVVDIEAFYSPLGVQFAGVTGRFTSKTVNLSAKVQESDAQSQDFERLFLYENPNAVNAAWSFKVASKPTTSSCIVRLVVRGPKYTLRYDHDRDGFFDDEIHRTTKNTRAGLIGATIWGTSEIDNFEFFNAVLQPAANASAKIGTSFQMELTTTARRPTPWRIALSAGNAGFPIGTRRIPLDVDPVFDLSIIAAGALGLSGNTDSSGFAKPALKIPGAAELVGFKIFAAAITLDATRPDGIDNISNEIGIEFVR